MTIFLIQFLKLQLKNDTNRMCLCEDINQQHDVNDIIVKPVIGFVDFVLHG